MTATVHPTRLTLVDGDSLTVEVDSAGYRAGLAAAPQLTVTIGDPGSLITHPLLDPARRAATIVADRIWQLRRVGRQARTLTLTLWEQPAAVLDPKDAGPALSIQGTVIDLAQRLTGDADVSLDHPDPDTATTPATTVERAEDETSWSALGRETDDLDNWVRFIADTPDGRGLTVGPLVWLADRQPAVRITEADPTVDPIDFDVADEETIDQVTLNVAVDGWDGIFAPGTPVTLIDGLPLPADWMVAAVNRGRLADPACAVTLRRIPDPKTETEEPADAQST